MEIILNLKNGQRISSKDIKCPICGKEMVIDKAAELSDISDMHSEIFVEPMTPPFEGLLTKSRMEYKTHFKCPGSCCELAVENQIENLIM